MSRRLSLLTDSVLTPCPFRHLPCFAGQRKRGDRQLHLQGDGGKGFGCRFDTFRSAFEKFCDSALELKTPAGKVRGTYYVKPGFEKMFRANVEAFKRGEAKEGTRKPRAEAGAKSRPRRSEREAGHPPPAGANSAAPSGAQRAQQTRRPERQAPRSLRR